MKKVIEYIKKIDERIEIIYPSIGDVNDIRIDITNYLICKINTINGLEI